MMPCLNQASTTELALFFDVKIATFDSLTSLNWVKVAISCVSEDHDHIIL